jgi:hypothetical protein
MQAIFPAISLIGIILDIGEVSALSQSVGIPQFKRGQASL